MFNKKENSVEKIIIKYDDGTEKDILKGAVITEDKLEDGEFEFIDIGGEDLVNLMLRCAKLGIEMGLFNE